MDACRFTPLMKLMKMDGTNVTTAISTDTRSSLNNETEFLDKIYVLRPMNPSTKLAMLLSLVVIEIIASVGNFLIVLFLKTKDRISSFLNRCSFRMSFNLYIKGLAISDILSSLILLSIICLQMYFEVLQRGWGCKAGKNVTFLFPCVTISNLLVISFRKYFSTRLIPRIFNYYMSTEIYTLQTLRIKNRPTFFCTLVIRFFSHVKNIVWPITNAVLFFSLVMKIVSDCIAISWVLSL